MTLDQINARLKRDRGLQFHFDEDDARSPGRVLLWLDAELEQHDGLVLGLAETRAGAVADAIETVGLISDALDDLVLQPLDAIVGEGS